MSYSPSITVFEATNGEWEQVLPFLTYDGQWKTTDITRGDEVLYVSTSRDYCEDRCDIHGEWRPLTLYRKCLLGLAPLVKAIYYEEQLKLAMERTRAPMHPPF